MIHYKKRTIYSLSVSLLNITNNLRVIINYFCFGYISKNPESRNKKNLTFTKSMIFIKRIIYFHCN